MEINFSYNWNGKLNNLNAFTTIRKHDPQRFFVGAEFDILLNGLNLGTAKIKAVKRIRLRDIDDFMGYLDTGYDAAETRKILTKMHKNTVYDIDEQFFDWILLVRNQKIGNPDLFPEQMQTDDE